jgi:16S rRNA (cytosine1402-N4)-methyltransferase
MEKIHIPVMGEEILEALMVDSRGVYIDATIGLGGHAEMIFSKAGGCTLIGIDRDSEALEIAGKRLRDRNLHLVQEKYSNIRTVADELGYVSVDGILIDAGVSTFQLKSEGRGFSFLQDEPLDMRMDRRQRLTAGDVVNKYPEKKLASVIWEYGEERYSRKIAREVISARKKKPVANCSELAGIIERTVGRRGRIHPATRTFQALRIEVNRELAELSEAVDQGSEILNKGGRLCVLSYHSLEDRIVKIAFKRLAAEGIFRIITRKPLVPSRREMALNPSSRSAKLRVGEKI